MNTAMLETYKLQLINRVVHDISCARNVEEIHRAISQTLQEGYELSGNEELPYTVEEIHARIDRAEAYFEAGNKGVPHEQVMKDMDELVESLCN